ncbi:Signal recognition particle SEC65 subunit [Enterospora canceri]|uniref:Signal recognition particle SEC65 subunit n=1 Tax=Enterospora canceri TaxID=1081671 RepID=A0A1Y1S9I8_9MICR|nr:Signal recognition particle SEC65 subunit [Enterospora canceri]
MGIEMLKENYFMLYPVYFELNKSKTEGRKYNKRHCLESIKTQEIRRALEACKAEYTFEPNKKHPRDVLNPGRFTIKRSTGRMELVAGVAEKMKEHREKQNASSSSVKNTMGLIAKKKSKKKGKK